MVSLNNLYIGTSGLVLPVPNKLHFPENFQQGSRLTYYASLHNSIEINSTFYKLPLSRTVEKWATEAPANFRFTFKIWKMITHSKQLAIQQEAIQNFFSIVNHIPSTQRGCILVQLPPSVHLNQFQEFKILLQDLARFVDDWPIAIELRHPSLYERQVIELLNVFQISLVIHDKSQGAQTSLLTNSQTVYIRFHGPQGNYRGDYEDAVLSDYASYVSEWLQDGKTVYAYFNNTLGPVYSNLNTFKRELLR